MAAPRWVRSRLFRAVLLGAFTIYNLAFVYVALVKNETADSSSRFQDLFVFPMVEPDTYQPPSLDADEPDPRRAYVQDLDRKLRPPAASVEDRTPIYWERKSLVREVCRRNGLDQFDRFRFNLRHESRQPPVASNEKVIYFHDFEDASQVTSNRTEEMDWMDDWDIPMRDTLIYNAEKKLTYCWTHKVASTSWNKIFLAFVGQKFDPAHMYKAAYMLRPEKDELAEAMSKKNLRFTFVRHPFERILSAYVEKFELAYTNNWVYRTYTPKIYEANGVSIPKDAKGKPKSFSSLGRPSFRHFVSYLVKVSPTRYNDHWLPQWLHCKLCEARYDVVGYLETAVEDSDFIVNTANVSKSAELPWHNKSKKKHGKDRKYSDPMDYFRELSLDLMLGLYDRFRLDFEMFNYSADEYFMLFNNVSASTSTMKNVSPPSTSEQTETAIDPPRTKSRRGRGATDAKTLNESFATRAKRRL